MKKTLFFAMATMAAAFAARGAAIATAESPEGRLDLRTGIRVSAIGKAETLAYSPRWANSSSCMIAADGVQILLDATDEGTVVWTPTAEGMHMMVHAAADGAPPGETLTARFAVPGSGTAVIDFSLLQTNATWTADRTWLVTEALTVPSGVSLVIGEGAVVKFMPGASLTVASGGSCMAWGVVFTHVNDDTAGGDTLMDGDASAPEIGDYDITGSITDNDSTEYRYMPPQTLTSSISSNTRLRGGRTYIVSNSVTVASGATLTLQPGAILKFDTGCSLTVKGTLDAQGTRAVPIVFTSLKDDEYGGDANGDGDKTYAQAGDWHQITGAGTVKLNYCKVLWCSAQNNQGALYPSGGTWQFDNSIVAHCQYDCMRSYGGTFTANNSVFMDASMGVAPSSGTASFNNCVFNYLTTAVRWGNGTFYNCIFSDIAEDIIDTKFYSSTLASQFYNCCFWNPESTGDHASAKVGQNGCFYADPLFVDAANGDFRVAANSPCVDAGDGTVAPETDCWGQPRMDVKRVKDKGTPNGDGVCPDIGIYEVPGTATVPLPDLAVISVATIATLPLSPGDSLTVAYTVTNRGAAAATGLVRDLFRFKGADASLGGLMVDAAEIEQAYSLAAGGSPSSATELTATLTVPTLKAGKWKVEVGVNIGNYPYEQNLSNNRATSEDAVSVELEAMGLGSQSVTVGKGETAGYVLSGLPTAGGVVRITDAGAMQIAAYGGNGVVPTVGRDALIAPNGGRGATALPTVTLADGSLLVVFPARAEGENAYLVLENGGSAAATVSVEVKETELKIYGAEPGRVVNAGEATITITGSGLAGGGRGANILPNVTLGGREAKSVEALNAAQIAATFDVDGMAAGTYDVTVGAANWGQAALPDAVEVYAAKTGAKLRAWLEMPSSVRDGRVFTGYVCYANEGDSPMTMPVFKIAREDSNTKMGLLASESLTETTLYVGGISSTHPAGVLKAGDEARIPFYFQPIGTYRIKLSHIKDAEDIEAYPTFGGTKAYLAAMSAAATRLNLRGRTVYSIHDFVDQALWEKNGVAHAAVSGYLVDAKTGEPLANTDISLVAADSEAQIPPATGATDESGYFQLTNLADGEYRWLLDGGNTLADTSTNTVTIAGQADVNGASVYATPGGRISGYVLDVEGRPVSGGTLVLFGGAETAVAATTVASEFGFYEFTGLADGVWSVRAQSQGFLCSDIATNLVIGAATRGMDVNFALKIGARLSGSVEFGGVPATNGVVQAITEEGFSYECPVEVDGTWSLDGLPVGTYDVRHYSSAAISPDREFSLVVGDDVNVVLSSEPRPLFFPTRSVGFGSLETSFVYLEPDRAAAATAWEWDFDSDGVIDSTVAQPTWTYSKIGTNTVTLVMTEADGTQTRSVYANCVRVEKPVETILKDGAILFGTNSGTLEAIEKGEGALILSGEPETGTLASGMTLMGQCNGEWFCRRILSVVRNGGKWELTTELADWSDIYDQVAMSFYVPLDLEGGASPAPASRALRAKAASRGKNELLVQGGLRAGVNVSPTLGFEAVQEMRNGRKYEKWALKGSVTLEAWYSLEGSATYSHNFKESVETPPVPLPAGFSLHGTAGVYANGSASIRGSLKSSSVGGTVSICLGRENYEGERGHWLPPGSIDPIKSEPKGEVEGSLGIEFGYQLGLKIKFLETASVGLDVDPYAKLTISASSSAPVTTDVSVGCKLHAEANLIDWSFGWFKVKVGVDGDVADISASLIKLTGADPDFTYTPLSCQTAPCRFDFLNQSKGAHIVILPWLDYSEAPKRYEWDFGDGSKSGDVNPYHTYQSKGKYTVSLKAYGDFITGPYRKKKTIQVGEKDDDDGDDEKDDDKTDKGKQSCDPNAMEGEEGVGDARYVKPGQELTYTIYFENKAGFDIADAQEVHVVNPLSEWLDWSTFEMREVAFNNQCDIGLDGLTNGMSEVKLNGTDKYVRSSVKLDAASGVISWYMRVYDPNGTFGWPNDLSGFLPSNDDTHRGEGHITYRVKVRSDAPANLVITNSASIVFDTNDPIETDPAWWNTVSPVEGSLQAGDYVKKTLAELGCDVPTDGTAYEVKAYGLPAGLQLKSNAALKDKKGNVTKKAKSEWWIEGVPTAALYFLTNPPYLVITANGRTETLALPVEVLAQDVKELDDLALGETLNEQYYLDGVGVGWTVSGLPTGLKYTAKLLTTKKKVGKKTVVTTNALPYSVYGKTTKAGLFTIMAKKKVGAYYETMKYRVLVLPKAPDMAIFGDLTNITTMAYVPVGWDLVNGGEWDGGHAGRVTLPAVAAVGGNVAKVAGLPTGLTFAAADTYKDKKKTQVKQYGQTIAGTPTKPGTYVVTFTKNVKSGKKTVAKTAQILWTVVANDAEVELGFNKKGGVVESGVVGLKYGDLLAFTATSNATVMASGLPAGITLADIGDGNYAFRGFTTKAGTYLVTVKATLNGKTVTQRVALKVDALPAWAKGTYNGVVTGTGATNGLATVTVSVAGKISGKFQELGTNWTINAASYTGYDAAASNYSATVTAKYSWKVKSGKKTVTNTLTREFVLTVSPVPIVQNVADVPVRGFATLVEAARSASGLYQSATEIGAWQNLWGSTYKAVGKSLFTTKSGKKTLAYKTFAVDVYTNDVGAVTFIQKGDEVDKTGLTYFINLSLKVTTAGAVAATLTYDTGKTKTDKKTKKKVPVYYKPTCSTVVIPTSAPDAATFTGEVPLYFAPSAANNFTGFGGWVPLTGRP